MDVVLPLESVPILWTGAGFSFGLGVALDFRVLFLSAQRSPQTQPEASLQERCAGVRCYNPPAKFAF
jgi:hypothetical protein